MKVKEIMTQTVQTIKRDATIQEAAEKMNRYKIGSLVVYEGGEIKGIITEGDILRAVSESDPGEAKVEGYMTEEVIAVEDEMELEEAADVMGNNHVKHVPVVDGDREMVGIICSNDLLKARSEMMERMSNLFMSQRSLLAGG